MAITRTNDPPLEITLEWFKNNCNVLDSTLAADFSDPIGEIVKAESWVHWTYSNDASPDCVHYFYDACLPKLLKTLLNRKYVSNDTHTNRVAQFLCYVGEDLSHRLQMFPECVTKSLLVLFNSRQPFYDKYGYPKYPKVGASPSSTSNAVTTAAPVDYSWTDDLNSGDCIDGQAPNGDWEIAIIDAMSPTRTEISVTWSTGVQEWLSFETRPLRVAKFGVMTGVDSCGGEGGDAQPQPQSSAPPMEIRAGADGDTAPGQSAATRPCAETVAADKLWRASLRAGDLVDAKDKSGFWYQACVMEILTLECVDSATASGSDNDRPQIIDLSDIDIDDAMPTEWKENDKKLKCELFAKKGDKVRATDFASDSAAVTSGGVDACDDADATAAMAEERDPAGIDPQQRDSLDIVTHGPDCSTLAAGADISTHRPAKRVPHLPAPSDTRVLSGDDMNNYMGDDIPSIHNDMDADLENTAANSTSAAAEDSTQVATTTFARVAFMGWLEWTDEWIDVSSDKIARLNSMSFGQRGDFHVRDEVKHIAKFWDKKSAHADEMEVSRQVGKFAASCNPVLVSPVFADVVQRFGVAHGFVHLCKLLQVSGYNSRLPVDASSEYYRVLSVSCCMDLLTAIGSAAEVICRQLLVTLRDRFSTDLLECARVALVKLMPSAELRSVNTESMERLIESSLQLQLSMLPDNGLALAKTDDMNLFVVMSCVNCDFLNRRLGGLKLLVDLVHRAQAFHEHPDGLRITRSSGTTTGQANTSSPTQQFASYTVVRATSFTPEMMCVWINSNNILPPLFVGDTAHTALMQRSADIFKFLSKYGFLEKELIGTLWEVGFTGKVNEALQVLQDLILAAMSIENMAEVLKLLSRVPEAKVSSLLTEIVESIAVRCRDELIAIAPQLDATQRPNAADIADKACNKKEALALHNLCLQKLWLWAADGSSVDNAVAIKCIPKIETIIALGHSYTVVSEAGVRFPWGMQWERGLQTLQRALQAVREKVSVTLALRTLRATLLVWMKDENEAMPVTCPDGSEDAVLPFGFLPLRHFAAEYLSNVFGLLDGVVQVVLSLKDKFVHDSQPLLDEIRTQQFAALPPVVRNISSGSVVSVNPEDDAALELTSETHALLNSLTVAGSRNGYKEQLECCFDFLHFLVRCSPKIRISFECVELIWKGVLLRAITPQERDAVYSFLTRLILHRSTQLSSNITSNGTGGEVSHVSSSAVTYEAAAEESKSRDDTVRPVSAPLSKATAPSVLAGLKEFHRASFCSPDTVSRIFLELLCTEDFVAGYQFNISALACVEKFYRWVGAANGAIVELPGKDGTFMLLKSLIDHTEWEIFPKIAMSCRDDKAAKDSITFVTMFPQRLSPDLMSAGDVLSIRQVMLKTCMSGLEAVRNTALNSQQDENDCQAVIGESKKLRRTLMLLHALIDESMADAGTRIQPHGGRWKSRPVSIRIQYSPKTLANSTITLDSNDLLEHLMDRIAAEIGKPVKELKMFRKGKEIVLGMFRRTLQQVDISPNEVILVADRPQIAATNTPVIDTALGSYDCPLESLPSVVLSNTPEYLDLLFALLDLCSGTLCDDIWGLILRLPTSPSVVKGWQEVSSDEIAAGGEDMSRSPMCLFGLQYTDINPAAEDNIPPAPVSTRSGSGDLSEHGTGRDSSGKRIRVTKSLSRLLYNMQVVENLLHVPENDSSSAEEVSSDMVEANQEDSLDDGDNWVVMFILLGGIPAIADAMEYTASQLERYLAAESESCCCCGVTAKLLLCTMGLVTRMYRAIILRSALVHCPEMADSMQRMLLTFSAFLSGNTSTDNNKAVTHSMNVNGGSPATPSSPIKSTPPSTHNACDDGGACEIKSGDEDKENALPPTAPPSDSEVSTAGAPPPEYAIIANEWGNKLNTFSSAAAELILSSVDLSKVQYTMCKLLVHVRSFSLQSIFYVDGACSTGPSGSTTSSLLTRASVQSAQDDLLEMLKNVFTIWTSAVIMTPRTLQGVEYRDVRKPEGMEVAHESNSVVAADCVVDSTELLQSLFMGYELDGMRLPSASIVRKSYLTVLVSMLAVEGMSVVVDLLCRMVQCGCDSDKGGTVNVLKHIYGTFMQSVLTLRPSVRLCGPPPPPPPIDMMSDSIHFSATALFEFAARLIAAKAAASAVALSLPSIDLCHVCDIILGEFSEEISRSVQWQKFVSGKYLVRPQLQNVAGSLQLIANLAAGEPAICDFLLSKDIVGFIACACVGIVPTEDVTLTTICANKESRKQAYNVLGLFLGSHDKHVAQKICNTFMGAHSGMPPVESWQFSPEQNLRSSVGYVGLRNMGCTCYMNSLLQVLYMMPRVRRGVLQTKIATTDPEELKNHLAYQLQVMFQHLQHSTRKSFYPEGWAYAYKDEAGAAPVNVRQQQDAQEFLQMLCERVERVLLSPAVGPGGTRRALLSEAFGGQLCDQMILDEGFADGSGGIREKTEEFVCLSVDVRGIGSLEASLRKYVEGETITDFLWEEGQPRVNITKRQCIGRLSDSIVLHLKRFELNFDTFMREKVNDEFTFPTFLDLYPFSKEGVSGKPMTDSAYPVGYYQYELGAIVVHTGTTDSGHYFSYIRESAEDAAERCRLLEDAGVVITAQIQARQWVTFDDSEIMPFSEIRIPSECFGGMTTVHDYVVSSQTWTSNKTANPKSAYMLVYHRTISMDDEYPAVATDVESVPSVSVVRDNQAHILTHRVFSGPHMGYMKSLQEDLLDPAQFFSTSDGVELQPRIMTVDERRELTSIYKKNAIQAVEFLTTHIVRSQHHNIFCQGCLHLVTVLRKLADCGIKSVSIADIPDEQVRAPQSPTYGEVTATESVRGLVQSPSRYSDEGMDVESEPPATAPPSVDNGSDPLLHNERVLEDIINSPPVDLLLAPELAYVLLTALLRHNGSVILGILFSPEKSVRGAFGDLLFQCFAVIYESNPSRLLTELHALSDTVLKSDVMTPFSLNDIPQLMEGAEVDVNQTAASRDIFVTAHSPMVELLLLLTKDATFLVCADQWRRAEAYMHLLAQMAPLHVDIRRFFIRREMIMQLVDLFIGDNSPCNGELYSQGSRKRAGTSYVSVVFDKNGKLPKSAEYIPDWTDLLHTLRWLVLSSYSNAMVRMATTPPTLNVHRSGAVVLDPYSHRCMTCKVFYTHALRQARYVDIINDIMAHYVYDDIKWTDDVASIILESITFAANDSTGHYFKALESFLSIHDNYVQHRASVVLDGQTGLLQMLKSCIVNKPTFVCICLFSLFKMALRINSVFSNLSTSQSKINEWAPWILKFCYQFGEKMRKETIALEFEQSIKSTTPSDANTPAPKKRGPFLTIYGECQPECEDTWVERGGKTFNLVQEVIRAMGAVPEVLIPADAFDDVVSAVGGSSPDAAIAIPDDIALPDTPDTGTIGVGGAVVNVNGGSTLPEAAFGDAMTDEEFARFMAETAGSELD